MAWYEDLLASGGTINESNAREYSYAQLEELQRLGIDVRPLLQGTSMYRQGSAADYTQEGMNPAEFAAQDAQNAATGQNYLSHVQGLEGPNSRAQYFLNPDGSIRHLEQATPESRYGKLNRFALVAGAGAAASYAGAGEAGAGAISEEAAAGEIASSGAAGGAASGTSSVPAAQVGGAGGIAEQGGFFDQAGNWISDNSAAIQAGAGAVGGILDYNAIRRAEEAQNAALDQAASDINAGYDSATGSINSGFDQARGDIAGSYEQSRADLEPFRQAGVRAQDELDARMPELTREFTGADLYSDPGFLFELEQGRKQNYAATASRGLSLSGGALRALTDYSQGLASTRFGEAFNRDQTQKRSVYDMYSGTANRGLSAASQMSSAAGRYGENLSNLATGRGRSLADLEVGRGGNLADIASNRGAISAAGIIGRNNAVTGAINNGVDAWQGQAILDLFRRGSGNTGN
ncbi:MAG: hypothetical protein ACRBC3_19670 [Burkholderiaceae bacterium]